MKKYGKLLPLFFVAPLLMSCGNVKVKKPEFAEKGSEKEFDVLYEAFEEDAKKSALYKEEALPSAVIEETAASATTNGLKRNDKMVESDKYGNSSTKKVQIDMTNAILHEESKSSGTSADVDPSGSESGASSSKEKVTYQEHKGETKTYLISVDENAKTYTSLGEVPEGKTAAYVLNSEVVSRIEDAIPGELSEIMNIFMNPYSTDEQKAGYKFYQNEKVYTFEYNKKFENEESKNLAEEVITVKNGFIEKIVQIDLSDEQFSVKAYSHTSTEIEYKKISSGYAVGDIKVHEDESASTFNYKYDAGVKLAAVDLSKSVALYEFK